MSTYLNLEELGIETFIFHRIKAFCPEANTLQKLSELCEKLESEVSPSSNFWTHMLHERPEIVAGNWKAGVNQGFTPTFTAGKSTASSVAIKGDYLYIARLLKQGVGIVTETKITKDESDLVERKPSVQVTEKSVDDDADGVLNILANKIGVNNLIMDGGGSKKFLEDTSYEVVEIVFKDKKALARLTCDDPNEEEIRLRKTIAYLLARSYDMDQDDKTIPPLERLVNELNLKALGDLVTVDNNEIVGLKNFSQTTRGFVTLGPRGAVIAYTNNFDHPNLRIAALNMIEILRGRHFNLIMARTLADDAIRGLSDLAHLSQPNNNYRESLSEEDTIQKLLYKIMLANYLYGLVVSDPGIFLLDGSTLTRLADVADTWQNLRNLREDTERKMEALHRLWKHFQDSERIHIIGGLRGLGKRNQ